VGASLPAGVESLMLAAMFGMSAVLFAFGVLGWVVPDFPRWIGQLPDPSPFIQLLLFTWVSEGSYLIVILLGLPPKLVIATCFVVIAGGSIFQPYFVAPDVEPWPSRYVGIVLEGTAIGLAVLLF
jgi:hypothetical protein